MTPSDHRAEVLEEFALAAEADPRALERYIRNYPDLATDLVDLAREFLRVRASAPEPLSRAEEQLVDDYWQRYSSGAPVPVGSQPVIKPGPVLNGRPVSDMRAIAQKLGLPRQVIAALRQGRVLFATLPGSFLDMLADAAGASTEALRAELRASTPVGPAGSFKADGKLSATGQVPFEQVLIEAGVDEDQRRELLGTR